MLYICQYTIRQDFNYETELFILTSLYDYRMEGLICYILNYSLWYSFTNENNNKTLEIDASLTSLWINQKQLKRFTV